MPFPIAAVQHLSDRNAIPAQLRVQGMTCYVADIRRTFQLIGGTTNGNWIDTVNAPASQLYATNVLFSAWTAQSSAANAAMQIAMAGTNLANLALNIGRSMVLCAAYSPVATGPDTAEVSVPYSPVNGVTPLNWEVRRLSLRVNTAGAGPAVAFESSHGLGVFIAKTVGTVALTTGAYEGTVAGSLGTVNSGDKLRFNVLALGSATNWTATIELGAVL